MSHSETDDVKTFGFWVYLMTDLVIFGVLFAAFAVLKNGVFHGPTAHTIFQMPIALTETLLLLVSSFTCSIAMLDVHHNRKKSALIWFLATFLLGLAFLIIELFEFSD